MAFDNSWNNVIYQLSPELLKFHVNAIHDTASMPSNLKLLQETVNSAVNKGHSTISSPSARLHLDRDVSTGAMIRSYMKS